MEPDASKVDTSKERRPEVAAIGTFTLALLLGIVSGTYSSIFNASPLLVVWHNWEDRKRAREHAARPGRRAAT